jgi:membrane fusion protein
MGGEEARLTAHAPISLFRPEVAAARKDRLHGDVSLAVPVSWQLIGMLLFVGVAAALFFLATASYSRVATVTGAIVVDKGMAPIVATRAGVIAQIAVHDGERVPAGRVLARIRSEEDLAGGGTAPQKVIDSLQEQDRQLGSQAAMILNAASAERSRLAATITGAQQEIETLDQQISEQQQLVALAETQFRQIESVAQKGFISRHDLDAQHATLISRRQQLDQLRQSRAAKLASLADARRGIAQAASTAQAQSVAVQAQRTQLAQQTAQFDAAKGYALTSPVAGRVTALTARTGTPAVQGQSLMVVVPEGGRMRVELYVPTSAAGFLKQGQEVRLAVDAFPYQQFGTVPARITDISDTVIAKQASDGAVPVYLVTAELTRASVRAFDREQPLLPGMTLTARIVTRRQTLLEWLFEPLFAVARR